MLLHYRKSGYGGFTTDTQEIDINSYINNFEKVEGDTKSNYAVVLLSSTIAHSYYDKIYFLNDLDECESILIQWLNSGEEKSSDPWLKDTHLYGMILDLKNNKELGYGDSWSNGNTGWISFTGIDKEEIISKD